MARSVLALPLLACFVVGCARESRDNEEKHRLTKAIAAAKARGFHLTGNPPWSVEIGEIQSLFDSDLELLASLPDLEFVSLQYCLQLTNAALKPLSKLKKLHTIILDGNRRIGDKGMAFLGELDGLVHLDISSTSVTSKGLESLKKNANLQYLGLTRSEVCALAPLAHFPKLKELYLNRLAVKPDDLKYLAGLQELTLVWLPESTSDAGLKYIKDLKKLEHLQIGGTTTITDKGLGYVKELRELRMLGIPKTKITCNGLGLLRHLTKLELLDASETRLGEGGLAVVEVLGELRKLWVGNTGIGDKDLDSVKALTKLEILDVSNNDKITDAGIAMIRGLTRLRELKLSGTSATDVCCEELAGLTDLRYLSVFGTKITEAGRKRLAAKNPELKIGFN